MFCHSKCPSAGSYTHKKKKIVLFRVILRLPNLFPIHTLSRSQPVTVGASSMRINFPFHCCVFTARCHFSWLHLHPRNSEFCSFVWTFKPTVPSLLNLVKTDHGSDCCTSVQVQIIGKMTLSKKILTLLVAGNNGDIRATAIQQTPFMVVPGPWTQTPSSSVTE